MCGIFGIISSNQSIDAHQLDDANSMLGHRGPDASGIYMSEDKKAGLAHTRLSILDLSDAANQPFYSSDRRYVMVFNGEVYNFQEVANSLHLQAKTNSDTEIIVEAFAKLGPAFIELLNGMFALAIWDIVDQRLHLFRDRMGIKPLYYYQQNGVFVFGSELKAIQQHALVKPNLSICQKAFYSFMHLGYIPEPLSVYQEIQKFPSGAYACFDGSNLTINKFWQLTSQVKKERITGEQEALLGLENLVNQSIKRRLISDAPLGTFLSGGIDSSLVSAIAAKNSNTKLQTFSIGFEEAKYDESQYARKVADYLDTDHTEFILSEKQALPLVEEMISTFDEPFADSSALPTMLISKLAAQQVKVILTGDGGDEQFHGYGAYQWATRMANPLLRMGLIKSSIKNVLSLGNSRAKRAAHLFAPHNGIRSHIFSQEQYLFANYELLQLLTEPDQRAIFSYEDSIQRHPAEQQAFFDLNYYLKDDLLVKVDRASMKYGLECRVPLLDHELVQFNLNLEQNLKMKNGTSKYLLKKLLFKHVPAALFDRPKWGFSIPLAHWLNNDLSYLIDEYLNEEIILRTGFFRLEKVNRLIHRFRNGETYLYNRLWLMILWNKWLIQNNYQV